MITRAEALDLFHTSDLIALATEADRIRKRLHPERVVSYPADGLDFPEHGSHILAFQLGDNADTCLRRLDTVREAQEATAKYSAVLPKIDATAVEYLRILALSRIYLDNVPHLQTSWSLGSKLCQIALSFGADDITGPSNEKHRLPEEQLRCLIRDAGFIPKQRDALFRTYSLD